MHPTEVKIPKCPGGEWKTAEHLERMLHKRNRWVDQQLKPFSDYAFQAAHIHGGRKTNYYPPCVGVVLGLIAHPVPSANGWVTRNQVVAASKGVLTWRTAQSYLDGYGDQAQDRLDKRHRITLHYPPWVLEELP